MYKAVRNTVSSRIITVTSLCLVVLLMGVFFATQSYSAAVDAIKINKNNKVEENVWNVKIAENSYKEGEGTVASTSHKIISNTVINEVTLTNPGEYIEYTFMIENKGNVDALLKRIQIEGLNSNLQASIKLNTEAFNSQKENVLGANTQSYITVKVLFKETEEEVEPQVLKLVTTVDLEQKEKED